MTELQETTEAPSEGATRPGPDRFESLYRESRDDLYSYLVYLVGDRSLAEEITAAAFERAFRKRSLFRAERGDLRGWLFSIARNAALDELRRSGRETALELIPEPAGVAPTEVDTVVDDRLALAAALRALQVRDRELIALKFFAGLGNEQIARVLRVSRSNAGTQLHRAMARLREQMEGAENGT